MSFDKQHVMGAAAEASEPALVSDQAPSGLAPAGFDQAQGVADVTQVELQEKCAQIADRACEEDSDASQDYDGGAGAAGYRMACERIAERIRNGDFT